MTKIDLRGFAPSVVNAKQNRELVATWRNPQGEGRPCDMMADFDHDNANTSFQKLADAQDAGLVRVWIDEYDGLFRAALTDEGLKLREELDNG